MSKLEKHLLKSLPLNLEDYAPSAKVVAYQQGKKILDMAWGEPYHFYDLASLTKIIFTNSVCMDLVKQKKLKLQTPIHDYLPWFSCKKTTVYQLLSHTSGMQWWKPYYKHISTDIPLEFRWLQLEELIAKEKPQSFKKAVYSDLDYFFLSFLIQNIFNKPLPDIWKDYQFADLHFNENNVRTYSKQNYAPTERCPWRKKILQGEVHDENAWALGGVSTHAGLFGSMDSLCTYGLALRLDYLNHPNSLKFFFRKATTKGDWTLGFMQPSKGTSSSGKYFSSASFGHTGFTGTSLWFDPKKDLLICILSNRVHPSRKNRKFVELRPLIHDYIIEGIHYA